MNQLIWKEINHFQNTSEILGEHPIFWKKNIEDEVNELNTTAAFKRIKALDNSIWRDESKLKKKCTKKEAKAINKRLKLKRLELELVKKKLNINE